MYLVGPFYTGEDSGEPSAEYSGQCLVLIGASLRRIDTLSPILSPILSLLNEIPMESLSCTPDLHHAFFLGFASKAPFMAYMY